VHFERSTDRGRTWTATPPLNDGKTIAAIQPSILVHPGNRLQALGRTRSGKIFETWSTDQGRSWSAITLIDLPNPSAGIDAVTLADGRSLIVYNHTASGRSPLNVAVSRDRRVWEAVVTLEDQPGREFSYPAVIQSRDGLIHITYTWHRKRIKHVVLDPARLSTRPIVGGEWPR
jgi:predicted neuraminidase